MFATSNPLLFQGSGVVGHDTFTVPADAPVTADDGEASSLDTYARFRVSTAGGLSPTGLAANGEVEDLIVVLGAAAAPTFSIAPKIPIREEGDSGIGAFVFEVTRSGDTSGTASVSFAVTGSGVNPAGIDDFTSGLPSGTLNFSDGQTSRTISINVKGDFDIEPDEGLTVTLSNPSVPATITVSTADGLIVNDDAIENLAPVLTLPSASVTYNQGSAPVLVDPLATITDNDSANFDGGSLTVEIESGSTANDRLTIRNQGTGAGQVSVSGNLVAFGGVTVGTISGGVGMAPLVVAFNGASTAASAQAVLSNLSYNNTATGPDTTPRLISAVVTDGDGGFSERIDSIVSFGFAFSIGDISSDHGEGIGHDAAGNVYVAGYFTRTVDVDPGPGVVNLTSQTTSAEDILVASYDASGSLRWAHSIGGTSLDRATDLAVDASGNLYVSGWFRNTVDFDPGPGVTSLTVGSGSTDGFVLRLDSDGNFVSAFSIGATPEAIAVDSGGNILITGQYTLTEDFDPDAAVFNLPDAGANADVFVAKYNASGNLTWAKSFNDTTDDSYNEGADLATDSAGNVYAVGTFRDSVDFDPGAAVLEFSTTTTVGDSDVFLVKLDGAGDFVFLREIGEVRTATQESGLRSTSPVRSLQRGTSEIVCRTLWAQPILILGQVRSTSPRKDSQMRLFRDWKHRVISSGRGPSRSDRPRRFHRSHWMPQATWPLEAARFPAAPSTLLMGKRPRLLPLTSVVM